MQTVVDGFLSRMHCNNANLESPILRYCHLITVHFLYTYIFSLQIIFYEEKNFQGRSYECSSDCADIHMHLNHCNSCSVDSGCFVVYDRPNFMGNQVFLRRGEYSDFQHMGSMVGMMGKFVTDTIRSCLMIPMVGHFGNHTQFSGLIHCSSRKCIQDMHVR